jgi:hypothetical protein
MVRLHPSQGGARLGDAFEHDRAVDWPPARQQKTRPLQGDVMLSATPDPCCHRL